MKLFIYKTIIIAITCFILFEVTIGYKITKYRAEINSLINKENLYNFKTKIKKEMESANKKDNYLNEDDRKVLSTFIKKIIKELEIN
tara:strand:+ start:512 stop:772 length:261 start_codon:yes stop_codon:yes gene_type:complete